MAFCIERSKYDTSSTRGNSATPSIDVAKSSDLSHLTLLRLPKNTLLTAQYTSSLKPK